jgi:hypothetical protein
VVVTDTLPSANHNYLFDTQECTGGPSGTATCDLGTIPAGTSKAFNIHIKVKGNAGVISNTADVVSSTSDPDLVNNSDTLENLIAGGTGESGGGGPGPNALSPSSYSLVEAEATCSRANPKAMEVTLEWLDDGPQTRAKSKQVQLSVLANDFAAPGASGANIAPGLNKDTIIVRLEPGSVYHWRIGHGNKWSGTASFDTPSFCPVYDKED